MDRETLLEAARAAARRAYAPYSGFRVGAAVLVRTVDGDRIITGANVENASYGLTLCAERAALAAACAREDVIRDERTRDEIDREGAGERLAPPTISAVAVSCVDVPEGAPAWQRTPCGACRQWLAELAPDAVYYIDGMPGELRLADLLPYAFRFNE